MEVILRAVVLYLAMLVIFRLTGKRTLAQITTFDLVLLLIISEAIQNGLIGEDFSLTTALLAVITLVFLDIVFSFAKQRSKRLEKLLDDMPLIIVENGKPFKERMAKCRVDEDDVLASARLTQGLERMEEIKYAVLEQDGGISIIPRKSDVT
jgi:uncharacterized membrane protein YcaP (DUF421 family)